MSWSGTAQYSFGQAKDVSTGQAIAASFNPAHIAQRGRFSASVNRRNGASEKLGTVEVLLISAPSKSMTESIAVCKIAPDGWRSLAFRPFVRPEFSAIKRHGNDLSLHAQDYVLHFHNLSSSSEEVGKWSRILSRVFGTTPQASQQSLTGLGISLSSDSPSQLPLSTSGRSLVPHSMSSKRVHRLSIGLGGGGVANDLADLLGPLQSSGDESFATLLTAYSKSNNDDPADVATTHAPASNPSRGNTDQGRVPSHPAAKETEPAQPEVYTKTERSTLLEVPSLPFAPEKPSAAKSESSSLATPSPSSLYLSGEDNTPPSSRLQSILQREKQQNLERYGAGAGLNSPPNILPPPVPTQSYRAQRASFASPKEVVVECDAPSQVAAPEKEDNDQQNSETTPAADWKQPHLTTSTAEHNADKKKSAPKLMGMLKKLRRKQRQPTKSGFRGPLELSPFPDAEQMKESSSEQSFADTNSTASASRETAAAPSAPVEAAATTSEAQQLPRLPSIPESLGGEANEAGVTSSNGTSHHTWPDHETSLSSVESAQSPSSVSKAKPVAVCNNNYGNIVTTASSGSISALSFRSAASLSSRSMRSRGMSSCSSANTSVAENPNQKLQSAVIPIVESATPEEKPVVPTNNVPTSTEAWQRFMDSVKSDATKKADAEARAAREAKERAERERAAEEKRLADIEEARRQRQERLERQASENARTLQDSERSKQARSLDPGPAPAYDLTQPILRKVFEDLTQNRSAPSLVGPKSTNLQSTTASMSVPNLVPSSTAVKSFSMFGADMWVSKWTATRWTPLSQLELRVEVATMTDGESHIIFTNPGGVGVTALKFSLSCEIRRASMHDVEVQIRGDIYMFRCRDADVTQCLFKTLAALQMDLRDPSTYPTRRLTFDSENMSHSTSSSDSSEMRRRTLVPPTLASKPRFSRLQTCTIIEE